MNAVDTIDQVLATGVLSDELLVIPSCGATASQIRDEEAVLGRSLSAGFVRFLERWNGANLDVLVLFGCRATHPEIPCLRERQALLPAGSHDGIVIGSDPAGFVFVEMPTGQILSVDSKGAEQEVLADSFDEFLCRHVFGEGASSFGGIDWEQELRRVGLLS